MNEHTINEILLRVDALASKIGITAEHLLDLLIKQIYTNLIFSGTLFIISGILNLIYLFHYTKNKTKIDKEWEDWQNTIYRASWLIFFIVTFGSLVSLIVQVYFAMNPELSAYKDLIKELSKLTP